MLYVRLFVILKEACFQKWPTATLIYDIFGARTRRPLLDAGQK